MFYIHEECFVYVHHFHKLLRTLILVRDLSSVTFLGLALTRGWVWGPEPADTRGVGRLLSTGPGPVALTGAQ